jgi:membrane protein DedA with SNARE-associated domain
MGSIELSTHLGEIFTEFSYTAPFVVLLLCGLGLPLPEEVTLIGAGLLLHQGEVQFVPISLVCATAILLGDSIPYWLGRRYGKAALRLPWVSRILRPDRFSRMERRFETHGNWGVFVCRFLAGVRIPGYFVAGTMRMSYGRFLLLDGLGVLITVPASIYVGMLFGGKIEELQRTIGDLHLVLAFLVLALALTLVVRARLSRVALKESRDRERAARLEAVRARREREREVKRKRAASVEGQARAEVPAPPPEDTTSERDGSGD